MHWGYLAVAPYLVAALGALVLSSRVRIRITHFRFVLLSLVIVGAVFMPLGLEAQWRHDNGNQGYAQPEVSVIERSGSELAKGQNPYRSYYHDGHVVNEVPGLPAYESFFPYFPLMGVFGLPEAVTHRGKGLTDARIVMTLLTLIASGVALRLLRVAPEKKIRVAQTLIALPTGALFLATGGDDMPILALMLLGVVGLLRRKNTLAGISLGVAAAMKLTAWPMALASLLVAQNERGARAWKKILLWLTMIVVVTIIPFVVKAPWAFMANVFAFPLGLAHVASPAASALPGHILTTLWTPLGHVLAPLTFLVGGYFMVKHVKEKWPLTLSNLLSLLALSFLVLMCVASATRIGYIIYPINFAVWSWVTHEDHAVEEVK
jgi:Glycosyltransferase family 87